MKPPLEVPPPAGRGRGERRQGWLLRGEAYMHPLMSLDRRVHDTAIRTGSQEAVAGTGEARSLRAILFLAFAGLLLVLAGMGQPLLGKGSAAGQKFGSAEGQFRPYLIGRQDAARVAQAPRPTSKPVLSGGGHDWLPPLAVRFHAAARAQADVIVLRAEPRAWRPYRLRQPRAPPAPALTA